jgi:hypothetical protein
MQWAAQLTPALDDKTAHVAGGSIPPLVKRRRKTYLAVTESDHTVVTDLKGVGRTPTVGAGASCPCIAHTT